MAITEKVYSIFSDILEILDKPKTFRDISKQSPIHTTNLSMYLYAMHKSGVIKRTLIIGLKRSYIYARLCDEVPTDLMLDIAVEENLETKALITLPGARLVSFNSAYMQQKLIMQDKLNSKERSRAAVSIGSSFNLI